MDTQVADIARWMRAQVEAAGSRGIVVGLSGGIDSAVVAGLAATATPGHVVGVLLPCHSDPRDESDAQLAAEHFNIPTIRIDLAAAYDRLLLDLRTAVAHLPEGQRAILVHDEVDPKARVPVANIKPRLRMTSLYFVANSLNYLVAGTGNRTELAIGYFTKYGDGGVDILPIGTPVEERGPGRRARAAATGFDHRESTERRTLAGSDRRGRNGLHLRRARVVLEGRPRRCRSRARRPHRSNGPRQRPQAEPPANV